MLIKKKKKKKKLHIITEPIPYILPLNEMSWLIFLVKAKGLCASTVLIAGSVGRSEMPQGLRESESHRSLLYAVTYFKMEKNIILYNIAICFRISS